MTIDCALPISRYNFATTKICPAKNIRMTHPTITLERFEIFGFLEECLLACAVTEKELQTGIEHLIAGCDDIGLLEIYPDLIECGEDRTELFHAFNNITHLFYDSPLRLSQSFALKALP